MVFSRYKVLVAGLTVLAASSGWSLNTDEKMFFEQTAIGDSAYIKSDRLATWVKFQNSTSRTFLDSYPNASALKARVTELTASNPPAGYVLRSGTEKIFLKAGSLYLKASGQETVLVDKANLNSRIITDIQVSPDESKIAYSTTLDGGDNLQWQVYDLQNRKPLSDLPTRIRIYDINWSADSKSFYYSKWPDQNDEVKIYKSQKKLLGGIPVAQHFLGDKPEQDKVVFANPIKSSVFLVEEDSHSNLLVASRRKLGFLTRQALFYAYRKAGHPLKWFPVIHNDEPIGKLVAVENGFAIVHSSVAGNNMGLVRYDLRHRSKHQKWKSIVPARTDVMISASRFGNYILAQYMDLNYENSLSVFDFSGQEIKTWKMKDLGLSSRGALPQLLVTSRGARFTSFVYSSNTQMPVTLTLDTQSMSFQIEAGATTSKSFQTQNISSESVQFLASDKEVVPMAIDTRKDLAKPKFIYLYYYGSNGIVNAPTYNRKAQLVLELGGAVVNLGARGGIERGAKWYKMGMKDRTRTAQDVIEAVQFLKQKFGDAQLKVAAAGRSYGGMMTNAVMARAGSAIDLYSSVAGVSDLELYLSDFHGKIAWDDMGFMRDRKGQIIDSPEARMRLRAWSPLNQIANLTSMSPAIFFTAENDERTNPTQTYLIANRLQEKFPKQSILMLEYPKAGHNARADIADEAIFIAKVFGL